MKKHNLIRRAAAALLGLTAALSLTACGNTASGETESKDLPIIGVAQYGEHGSLDNCRTGFLQGLEEAGLEENVDYKLDFQNAGFDDSIDSQIAQKFADEDAALMVGIATPSAVACYNAAEEKVIPVIFIAVTDPAGAKLDSGNVTGTSDVLPVEGQLQLIRELQPEAKTIGIIYTTSESNSLYSIGVYEEKAADYGFTIDAVAVTAQSEVTQAVDKLLSDGVDCLSNLTDNNVVGVLPVYGSEVEQVKLGCVAGAGLDYVKLGAQTGAMAAKILKGESTCADLPYEIIENYDLYVNSKALSGRCSRRCGARRAAWRRRTSSPSCARPSGRWTGTRWTGSRST